MTIQSVSRIVFRTKDGTEYLSKKEAEQHEFRLAITQWATANFYFGMTTEEIAAVVIETSDRLKAIFEEYL